MCVCDQPHERQPTDALWFPERMPILLIEMTHRSIQRRPDDCTTAFLGVPKDQNHTRGTFIEPKYTPIAALYLVERCVDSPPAISMVVCAVHSYDVQSTTRYLLHTAFHTMLPNYSACGCKAASRAHTLCPTNTEIHPH